MTEITVLDHASQKSQDWRPGVVTTMHVSGEVGSRQLCIFEQRCVPGTGAPLHVHAVEEVLTVLAGRARVTAGEAQRELSAHQSVVVPAGLLHGFENIGADELHVRAILASPIFEAAYGDAREMPRRWAPPI